MARDKARDDKYFNCGQESELNYVSQLYPQNTEIKNFLKYACNKRFITYSKHKEVYEFIKKELGYEIPN